jgi:putative ABC transport system permease protein
MRSLRWRTILRNLWGNKTRALLAILSIVVGVFAVGVIAGSRVILARQMRASFAAVNPASAVLFTSPLDADLVQSVRGMPGVREVAERTRMAVQVQVGPDQWRNLALSALPDSNAMRVDILQPLQGGWPPATHEIVIERGSLDYLKVQVGDTLRLRLPGGELRELRVAGVARDIYKLPAGLQGGASGYISPDTIVWLGGPHKATELHIIVAEQPLDRQHVQQVANQASDLLEQHGAQVDAISIATPDRHPLGSLVQGMLLILGIIGVLALLLSGFLVINMTSALLAEQVRYIGVMKAIGARRTQVIQIYLGMVLMLGGLALLIALPLGILGMGAFTRFIADLLNVDITSVSAPPQILGLMIAVGLGVPLLAALYPILAGTRITVYQAINHYGLDRGNFGADRIDRLLGRIDGLYRPILLALRNTVRRKGRLSLTLVTLTLASAVSISVFSVRASLNRTLDETMAYFNDDVAFELDRAYPIEQIEPLARSVPGVVAVESWGQERGARRLRPDGSQSESITVWAPPATTTTIRPTVLQGRWLRPEDDRALVINPYLLTGNPDIKVGDEIVLNLRGRPTTWKIIGLIKGVPLSVPVAPFVYTNYTSLARALGEDGLAPRVQIEAQAHDAASQSRVARALEDRFNRAGLRVKSVVTGTNLRGTFAAAFNSVAILLLVVAMLLTLVGGLGLMGTMSLNVVERTRELGIMRAIGASSGMVRQIIVGEGVLIGLFSWGIGVLLALPLSSLLSAAVGLAFIQSSLSFIFSLGGAILWMVVVIALAGIASVLPAQHAVRLTVREVLAYE